MIKNINNEELFELVLVDEEDGVALSNVGEFPDEPKKENVTPDGE